MKDLVELYKRYERPLYRFLLALTCGDEAMAEELVQETFYQAFLHIDQFEGRSQLLTWLCQIGKNAWLKECRRKNRYSHTPPEELPLMDLSQSPEDEVMKKQEIRQILQSVEQLEEPYREVFMLHVFGERKLRDIAALYGKSESWARVTYFRAKNQIAKEVSK